MLRVRDPVDSLVRQVEGVLFNRPRVLAYHSIDEPSETSSGLSVSAEHFDEHLAVLTQAGRVVRLDELLQSGTEPSGRSSQGRFALTLDDGYADNLVAAVPVLEKYETPATVFIASDFIDRPHFWWDRLAEIILDPSTQGATLTGAARDAGLLTTGDTSLTSRFEFLRRLTRELSRHRNVARYAFLGQLEDGTRFVPRGGVSRPLSSSELYELSTHPLITIGNHTHTHRPLTEIPQAEALGEILECDRRLDDLIGSSRNTRLLAYPGGAANGSTARIALEAGRRQAFTMVPRRVSLIDNPRLLPRIAISDVDGDEFARLRGLY